MQLVLTEMQIRQSFFLSDFSFSRNSLYLHFSAVQKDSGPMSDVGALFLASLLASSFPTIPKWQGNQIEGSLSYLPNQLWIKDMVAQSFYSYLIISVKDVSLFR